MCAVQTSSLSSNDIIHQESDWLNRTSYVKEPDLKTGKAPSLCLYVKRSWLRNREIEKNWHIGTETDRVRLCKKLIYILNWTNDRPQSLGAVTRETLIFLRE